MKKKVNMVYKLFRKNWEFETRDDSPETEETGMVADAATSLFCF